jgi:hypothetical protein
MEIFGQTPAEIADVLLSMAKPGETITVGGAGYTESQARAVVAEIWLQHAEHGLTITSFRSVMGVLDVDKPYHGKPVTHLAEVFDPTVEIVLAG